MSGKPSFALTAFRFQAMPAGAVASGTSRYLVWYQCAVLAIALCANYANLPVYAYTWHAALLPKYTYFLLFLLMMPLVLARHTAVTAYLLSPFALWAGALVVVNLIHLSAWSADGGASQAYLVDHQAQLRAGLVSTRIQYVLFSIMLGFVAFITPARAYLYTAVALSVLLPCAVLLDFASPGLFYPLDTPGAVLGRAAAMFINPTMAGEAVLHVFVLGCAVVGIKYRGLLFLLAGAGILATFSRSSIIAWGLILLILVVRKSLPRAMVVATVAALVALVLGLGSFEHYLSSRDEFEGASSNILSRLEFFSNFNFDDDSSEERAGVIKAGWEIFMQNPVFGAGAGATLFWSHRGGTHNQLLLFAAEYGLFGIGLWAWLLATLWRGRFFAERGLQLAMVFLFAFMSMFTHQMLDAASYWLTTFALVSTRAQWTTPGLPQRGGRRRGRPAMLQCTRAADTHNLKQRSGTQP
jgi:hypothetical protein